MGLIETAGARMAQMRAERMDRRIAEMMDQFAERVPVLNPDEKATSDPPPESMDTAMARRNT